MERIAFASLVWISWLAIDGLLRVLAGWDSKERRGKGVSGSIS